MTCNKQEILLQLLNTKFKIGTFHSSLLFAYLVFTQNESSYPSTFLGRHVFDRVQRRQAPLVDDVHTDTWKSKQEQCTGSSQKRGNLIVGVISVRVDEGQQVTCTEKFLYHIRLPKQGGFVEGAAFLCLSRQKETTSTRARD